MEQIINNMLYNTDSSILIHTEPSTRRQLYKTKNGNYFMLYNNGEIVPKTVESTKEYLGMNNVEAYIKEFGKPEEA